MDKLYKLKHKPTGLYYQPLKGKNQYATNLSKKGKIYQNSSNALIGTGDTIYVDVSEKQYNEMKDIFDKLESIYTPESTYHSNYRFRVLKSDFEKEYL